MSKRRYIRSPAERAIPADLVIGAAAAYAYDAEMAHSARCIGSKWYLIAIQIHRATASGSNTTSTRSGGSWSRTA
jgi:hypothetical protein